MTVIGRWGALVLMAGLTLLGGARAEETAPPPAAPPAAAPRPVREFNLFVKEWAWEPSTLRVAKGSHVVLHIESLDALRSFSLKDYGVKAPLPENERVTVEFDADKEGAFEFKCGRPCGNGCAKLRGTLTVH
jgi:heme/copper-type cytochrome/quinol oxidase subunit 2